MSTLERATMSLACLTLCCAPHAPSAPDPDYVRVDDSPCVTPMPLELRATAIEERLSAGFAHVPPLSRDEYEYVASLMDCLGVAMLGGGEGCTLEREATRASGLAGRYQIREGQIAIPRILAVAAALPLGAERTEKLIVAMRTAAEDAMQLRAYLSAKLTEGERRKLEANTVYVVEPAEVRAYVEDPEQLDIVAADLEQAVVCDAQDMASGRRRGLPYDPRASVPEGQ